MPKRRRLLTGVALALVTVAAAGCEVREYWSDHGVLRDAAGRRVIEVTGDPEVCLPFLERADEIEYIEPVLPKPEIWRFLSPDGSNRTWLRFVDFEVMPREFYAAVDEKRWADLFLPENTPIADEFVSETLALAPRWRDLNYRCPGFLYYRFGSPERQHAPIDYALYEVDIDNDGAEDTLLYRTFPSRQSTGTKIVEFDFESCTLTDDVLVSSFDLRVARMENINYFIIEVSGGMVKVHRKLENLQIFDYGSPNENQTNEELCYFTNIYQLNEYNPAYMTITPRR